MSVRKSIDAIPGVYEKRVFVGGNYLQMATLRDIYKYVKESGDFVPVLADEYFMEDYMIHDETLRLLHNCKHAIFEVTYPSGQLMELERVRDFGTNCLVLYQIKEPSDVIPEQITKMLTTMKYKKQFYRDDIELKKRVKHFLFYSQPENFVKLCLEKISPIGFDGAIFGIAVKAMKEGRVTETDLIRILLDQSGLDKLTPKEYFGELYTRILGREKGFQENDLLIEKLEKGLEDKAEAFWGCINSEEFIDKNFN